MTEDRDRRLRRILDWLLDEGRMDLDPAHVVGGLAEICVEVGAPVDRINMGFRTLHPNVSALTCDWRSDRGVSVRVFGHGLDNTNAYVGSPVEYVVENRKPFRRRLHDLTDADHEVLHEIAASGHTDYTIMALPISDDGVILFGASTKQEGGFTDIDLENLHEVGRYFAPVGDLVMRKHVTESLLNTYLGSHVSTKVMEGQVKRGDGDVMHAAILFADLRGFTRLTESLPDDEMLALLDVYFDVLHSACSEQQGEIRRFVGDAMLVTFPGEEPEKRAVAAARAARARFAEINQDRELKIGFGIGLNTGRVLFGNVGAPSRLDFTVMGPAVNLTQRIESLTKGVGEPVLMSRAVAEAAGVASLPRGSHSVKGVADPIEVYALPED